MQENNPTPIPEAIPTSVIEQPKQSNFLTILLSILLLISVAISGFFAYQTQKLVKELTNLRAQEKAVVDISAPVATEISEVSSTADWKTYTNKEYNFSIQYPADAKLSVNQPESNDRMMVVTFDSPRAIFDHIFKSGGYSFQLSMQTQKNFNTLDEYLVFQKEHSMYEKVTPKTFNNVNGYLFYNDKGFPGLNFTYRGFVTKNNDLFYTVNYFTDETSDIFNQILSTFKFLE